MKAGYKVTLDRSAKVLADLQAMTALDCLIGIPEGNSVRKDGKQEISNAQIGYQNEFGSAANNIPPRPFLIPGVQAVQDEVTAEIARGIGASFQNPGSIRKALERSGMKAVASVKAKIRGLGNYSPDSPTVKARKAKGFNGTAILRVTGQLINSITYVVQKRTA